jgi:hypothetical protein
MSKNVIFVLMYHRQIICKIEYQENSQHSFKYIDKGFLSVCIIYHMYENRHTPFRDGVPIWESEPPKERAGLALPYLVADEVNEIC